jgi:DNA-binding transcriptional LysR family regulator
MSLRQMEYLLAVVEEGSFTRAAQRLSVSQPALSHQVRALERSVGQPLLERLQDNVRLTPMGRAYLPHAVAALHSAHEAWKIGRPGERAEKISLRIAAVYSIALGVMPSAIRTWRRAYPDADVEVLEFPNFEDMADQMALGVADVAVGPLPPRWSGPVHELGTEEIVVVLAADDPFLDGHGGTVRLTELADRSWVLYAPENGLTPLVTQECARAGFNPRAAVRTHHTATAVQLAAAGLGPALVPSGIIEADFPGVQLEPDPPIHRKLVAITPDQEVEYVSMFIDLLAERGADWFRRRRENC